MNDYDELVKEAVAIELRLRNDEWYMNPADANSLRRDIRDLAGIVGELAAVLRDTSAAEETPA